MIVIQTDNEEDTSDDVMDWIFYLGVDQVKRSNNKLSLNNTCLRINNRGINSNVLGEDMQSIKAYWYRRGYFSVDIEEKLQEKYKEVAISLHQEYTHYISALAKSISLTRSINSFNDNATNKLNNLIEASLLDLKIPDTIVTASYPEIKSFADLYSRIISKAITNNRMKIAADDNAFLNIAMDTAIFDHTTIEKYKEQSTFLPALFQEYIEKKYELRIFYLHGKFYTMAIFSQANEKTKIDFRKYDRQRPNRCVSYVLPKDIEDKLTKLMEKVNLNSGSIDMIYTHDKEYVFLEVNPIGQFQWLSANCNYDVERSIAQFLIHGQ